MILAQVVLEGGVLVVRFRDGTSRSSGISVTASMSETDIGSAITRAKTAVAGGYYAANDDAHGQEAERASGNAHSIFLQLHPEQREQREPPPPPPQRRERTQAPPPAPRERRREERREEGTRGRTTPRPTISRDWISTQIRDASREERRSVAAANALRTNSAFLNQFLSRDLQRGTLRTPNQTETTITVFNALYQIPSFRLLLSSIVAERTPDPTREDPARTSPRFPEFGQLLTFLSGGTGDGLSEQATADIIRAADYYVRYYLLAFVAPNEANSRFRAEITQLGVDGGINWRLQNVDQARTMTPPGRPLTQLDRDALMRPYLGGAMDSDTIVAAALWIRRWTQEHPQTGRGRTQDQIVAWQAPAVVPLEEQQVAPPPTQVVTTTAPRIAVIGDSILAGGRMGTTLQTTLRRTMPEAVVDTYAHVGDALPVIRQQYTQNVANHQPPYNTLILEGGINSIVGNASVQDVQSAFSQIIRDARAAGMRVIIITVTPWMGYQYSSTEFQARTAAINTWLRSQAGEGVVVVDSSPLGEGNPPRLRAQFERTGRDQDHLHPNEAGRDLLARLVAQGAYNIAPTTDDRRTALQDFADRNWRNLGTELYNSVSNGNVEGIVAIIRNRPEGSSTVEDALRTLNRDDISRATDRVFNDYLRADQDFLRFCREFRQDRNAVYAGVARDGVSLSASTSDSDRRMIIRAMQEYLNWSMNRTDAQWFGRLHDDLGILYRQVLSLSRDNFQVDGVTDMRTLASISLYSWRRAHQDAAVGAWGPNLSLRVETQQRQQVAPPPPPPPPPPTDQGRRRIQF